MKKLHWILAVSVAALVTVAVATAAQPPAKTFIAVLSEDEEVPLCLAATNAAGGLFIGHVVDEATGTVRFKLVANNLPGTPAAAHIHLAPKGVAGGVVQPLGVDPGEENGVIRESTFSNPALVAAMRANPDNYYVNVHSDVCPAGVVRGQLGDHGPSNN
jgi:hypothetical protein